MVYVNDKKFACESCIKGHRSSGCQHADRPLFEVKKKGRPVSQCDRCRELRKTKRMHSKCNCASMSAAGSSAEVKMAGEPADGPAPKSKSRRFKPIAPALPNGLKDVLASSDKDIRVEAPLNLCRCGGKDATICTCGHDRGSSLAMSRSDNVSSSTGLAALAQAALFCCGNVVEPRTSDRQEFPPLATSASTDQASRKHSWSCCSTAPNSRPPSPKPKRTKHSLSLVSASASASTSHDHPRACSHSHDSSPVALPALRSCCQSAPPPPPVFPAINPSSVSAPVAESGCSCGIQCACPGCLQHRGAEHAAKDVGDCEGGGCNTCIDHEGGIELRPDVLAFSQGGFASTSKAPSVPPTANTGTSSASSAAGRSGHSRRDSINCIDAFFATAASLPAPPPWRTGALDPTNVLVYPRGIFAGDSGTRSLFGLVEVPKLKCNCPGGCGCPEGQCACGDNCTGCAPARREEQEREKAQEVEGVASSERRSPKIGSCCG